jgi:outer membrane protein insertion porin family
MFKCKMMLAYVPAICAVLLFISVFVDPNEIAAKMETDGGPIKVLVLPFQIIAQQDLFYLRGQIADVIAKRLEDAGAVTITPDKLRPEEWTSVMTSENPELIRRKARELQVDQVVWGTFTLIGGSFSLDVRLMAVQGQAPPQQFFTQGRNLENLITVTNQTADRIGVKLFHRQIVKDIRIEGNHRIESDAILRVIKTQKGSVFKPEALSKDLRAV